MADFVLTKSRKKHKIKKGFCEILLAEDSKATADDSNANNQDIRETIERLVEEAGKLTQIVEQVNGRASSLVASAEETAVSIGLMNDVAENVESSLRQILQD